MIRRITFGLFAAMLFIGLAACGTEKPAESGTKEDAAITSTAGNTESSEATPSSVSVPDEYVERYKADAVVYDMLIPNKALLIGETDVVCLLMLEGITTETVIPRESIARTEKTEVSGMVVVKIADRTGKEISMTLSPEDAGKVDLSK